MSIEKLIVQDFRNLTIVSEQFDSNLNFLIGDNGSGKSSLLEAIFYLGHGKSFRTAKLEHLLKHEQTKFVISVKTLTAQQLGISKQFTEDGVATEIKMDGERISRLSELAKNIAVQIVTPESFKLFFGGPKQRRSFIDLGVFHVKHNFSDLWKEFARLLKQRNACLKNKVDDATLDYWTQAFVSSAERVACVRDEYVTLFKEELDNWLQQLLPSLSQPIKIQYLQGWSSKKNLMQVLSEQRERERHIGFSLYGAHKFDVKFLIDGVSVDNLLSRGQQKLFLLALTFAQAKLIAKVKRIKPILLIDDVGAELDQYSRRLLAKAIKQLEGQVIITAIDKQAVEQLKEQNDNYKMFHVKHGKISVMSE